MAYTLKPIYLQLALFPPSDSLHLQTGSYMPRFKFLNLI